MIGVVGNHEDTRTFAHLLEIGGDACDLQRGGLSWIDLTRAECYLQTAGKHLQRRDDEWGVTRVRQRHFDRFLRFLIEISKVDIRRGNLQLWCLILVHIGKSREIRQENS